MNTAEKKRRSPPEKKALSLKRDRRNLYGENSKSSRKAIPFRKALESRTARHRTSQALAQVNPLDAVALDLVESSARHDVARVGGWKKWPDEPLEMAIRYKIRTLARGQEPT